MKLQGLNFRIWDKRYNQYVEGNIGIHKLFTNGKWNIHFLLTSNDDDTCEQAMNDDDFEIELYVESDKNGKELYENDIIKVVFKDTGEQCRNYPKHYILFWDKKDGMCVKECLNPYNITKLSNIMWIYDIELMGNIHENPELIGGRK